MTERGQTDEPQVGDPSERPSDVSMNKDAVAETSMGRAPAERSDEEGGVSGEFRELVTTYRHLLDRLA